MRTDCDLDTPVPIWVIEHPETLSIFREHGIDDSCGGKSLRYACQQQNVAPEHILTILLSILKTDEHS
ncbi:MAG: DUF542 domain-containing protein [Rubinisphaera brasiliensis]|uniref:Uncharacterized protein n=1 Tax=Rubinisphaera brasiliensis (strain ATCC 49424 / DSM 5305 / JCM 21570 / IAM 15109 / NBRC 103401 / IFAM 1448) TaxID=756272 RepID=F0SIA9_RUBBR|nr:DUF542 domain-containing protein [Rubinisphaera brasiliensis]ADY58498.1 hypothetical protein Plabr_0875 [Rubinisphaera brasiliensis DSM 5305]MBR9801157.1 hypothetical protein [bacterium]